MVQSLFCELFLDVDTWVGFLHTCIVFIQSIYTRHTKGSQEIHPFLRQQYATLSKLWATSTCLSINQLKGNLERSEVAGREDCPIK